MPPSDSTADLSAALRSASEPHVLRKLDRLRFAPQRSVSQLPGASPVARATQASGLELANHKPYAPGDDLRHIDWNAYGRLDQRVIKTFRAEREAPVHLLLDASASMGVPAADAKLAFAAGVAAGLAYVALRQGNPVRAAVLAHDRGASAFSPLVRHVQRLPELHAFLARLTAGGPTRLGEGIDAYLHSTQLPGTVVVLSDVLVEPSVYESAFDRLCGRGYDVAVLRVLGGQERDPSHLPRHVRLHDVETGGQRVLELTAVHRRRYRDALASHLAGLKAFCDGRAVRFAVAETDRGLDACLCTELPRAGLLQ